MKLQEEFADKKGHIYVKMHLVWNYPKRLG